MSFPKHQNGYWAYETVLDLDRFAPGLLGEVLRGTDTRRQVICAALSLRDCANLSDQGKLALAHKLRFLKSRTLIADTFGSSPEGFIACLAKMRDCYLASAFYAGLFLLYTNPLATEAVSYLNRRRGFSAEFAELVPPALFSSLPLGVFSSSASSLTPSPCFGAQPTSSAWSGSRAGPFPGLPTTRSPPRWSRRPGHPRPTA